MVQQAYDTDTVKSYSKLWEVLQKLPDNKKVDLLHMVFGWMQSAKDPKFQVAIDTLLKNHFKD
jgi:hypothetical protein